METSMKNSIHTRCNSLPSASHPYASQFQEHLQRLKDSEAAATSLSSSSINQKLIGLQDLHDYAIEFLQLPTTRKALAQESSGKLVDDLIEGSLKILDICSIAQDCLLQTKENIHEIQSVIRRKGAEIESTVEGGKYLESRKKMKKAIKKALANLKGMKKTESVVSSSKKDNETLLILSILKEAETVTLRPLESLLLFISDSKGQLKNCKWSLVSKLMQPARVNCDSQEFNTNEFVKVDETLKSLISHKPLSAENLLNHTENMEICIQDIESEIEHLSRQLIRTRVSLLNIFSY